MVKELLDGGAWTLPGGWADINEMPSTAVEREVREEAGVIVKATKLLAVFDRNLHGHPVPLVHSYKLFFLWRVNCRSYAGSNRDSRTDLFF